MNKETENAINYIKLIGDRCVQRGNIFTGAEEVLTFIQSYNTIVKKVLESEQRAMNNKQLSMNNEPLKATS